jgi:hypothetical protein
MHVVMVSASLEGLLHAAATSADWNRDILHRCAWCQRIIDADGNPLSGTVELRPDTVVTDGMCKLCGAQALVSISRRRAPAAA